MSNWWLPVKILAGRADQGVKDNAGDEKINLDAISGITSDQYPTFTDELLYNLSYLALYAASEQVRGVAQEHIDGYRTWKRGSWRSYVRPALIATGVAAVGYVGYNYVKQKSN